MKTQDNCIISKNSEILLLEISDHEEEGGYWESVFYELNQDKKNDYFTRFKDLKNNHLITFSIALNCPKNVRITKQGKEYLAKMNGVLFISHSSKDEKYAKIIKDFLLDIGVPNNRIFCTSISGNGVHRRISSEIKEKLRYSILNLVILSNNYYQSIPCTNEMGIIWYLDTDSILLALPEITSNNIQGFYDKNDYLRRFDNAEDILVICKTVCRLFRINEPKYDIYEIAKNNFLDSYNSIYKI